MLKMRPEIWSRGGKKEFVILPYDQYKALCERLEDADDSIAPNASAMTAPPVWMSPPNIPQPRGPSTHSRARASPPCQTGNPKRPRPRAAEASRTALTSCPKRLVAAAPAVTVKREVRFRSRRRPPTSGGG